MRIGGLLKSKDRMRMPGRRKAKVARVTGVQVDQLVTCPRCGNPMHLSELLRFSCTQCMQELTAEQALTVLEAESAGK
jgi:hypothetical protein